MKTRSRTAHDRRWRLLLVAEAEQLLQELAEQVLQQADNNVEQCSHGKASEGNDDAFTAITLRSEPADEAMPEQHWDAEALSFRDGELHELQLEYELEQELSELSACNGSCEAAVQTAVDSCELQFAEQSMQDFGFEQKAFPAVRTSCCFPPCRGQKGDSFLVIPDEVVAREVEDEVELVTVDTCHRGTQTCITQAGGDYAPFCEQMDVDDPASCSMHAQLLLGAMQLCTHGQHAHAECKLSALYCDLVLAKLQTQLPVAC